MVHCQRKDQDYDERVAIVPPCTSSEVTPINLVDANYRDALKYHSHGRERCLLHFLRHFRYMYKFVCWH